MFCSVVVLLVIILLRTPHKHGSECDEMCSVAFWTSCKCDVSAAAHVTRKPEVTTFSHQTAAVASCDGFPAFCSDLVTPEYQSGVLSKVYDLLKVEPRSPAL